MFAAIRAASRQPVLDVIKLVKYRADFYSGPMQRVTQEAMRGPSAWSVADCEKNMFVVCGVIFRKSRAADVGHPTQLASGFENSRVSSWRAADHPRCIPRYRELEMQIEKYGLHNARPDRLRSRLTGSRLVRLEQSGGTNHALAQQL